MAALNDLASSNLTLLRGVNGERLGCLTSTGSAICEALLALLFWGDVWTSGAHSSIEPGVLLSSKSFIFRDMFMRLDTSRLATSPP